MFLGNERGSVQVIEAALVYPLVILSTAALLYFGMYVFESSLLSDRANAVAVTASKTVVFTGYGELGDIYTRPGLRTDDEKPDRKRVDKYYAGQSPYRYLKKGTADERFEQMISAYASDGFFTGTGVTCTVDVKRRIFDREVVVTVEKDIRMPGVLKALGAPENRKMTVTASAVTSDPAEFVRNTDLTLEAVNVFGEKTGLSSKLSGIRSRINGILGKMGAGKN